MAEKSIGLPWAVGRRLTRYRQQVKLQLTIIDPTPHSMDEVISPKLFKSFLIPFALYMVIWFPFSGGKRQ